jgi:hypothetical protein
VPKAPPIQWFFSWIKGEPFGDNVPIITGNNMPEPIAKVQDDDSDLSLDLDAELAGGKGNAHSGDPGDIFGENPPQEKTMA